MASTSIPLPSTASEFHDYIHAVVKSEGSEMAPVDFIHAGTCTSSCLVANEFARESAAHREHAIRRGLHEVLRAVPKECSGCRALEVHSQTMMEPIYASERISVLARCTANVWSCPKTGAASTTSFVEWNEISLPKRRDYPSITEIELEMEVEPRQPVPTASATPKTKTDLVW